MSAIKSANKSAKASGADMVKQEDVVVAVLIADSFSVRFAPLTESKPKALLPIVNRPMIDYSLESLLTSGVNKVYIYCVSHADQIRNYLKGSKWTRTVSPLVVEVLSQSPDKCQSLGDCMRDIDNKSLIRGDFILLSSDVISNVQLIPILEKHKEKKKTDKGLIITQIFSHCHSGHRSRSVEEEIVVAINPTTERILNYQHTSNLTKLKFPLKHFKEQNEVQMRYDLKNTHISICSPTVLPLFTDEFDYETMTDMMRGILSDEENLAGHSINYHLLEGSYVAQVSNVSMYDATSKDIIQRWAYPLVPDLCRSEGNSRHSLSRHNVYKQPDVILSKGSVLGSDVVIGRGSFIGERTHITQSVIGSACKIGSDVDIINAYLWDNVIIKDKCRIDLVLIADGVVLGEGVQLGRGCVLGPGVFIEDRAIIPPNTRLMAYPPPPDEFADDDTPQVKPFTPGSKAYIYQREVDQDSDDGSLVDDFWGLDIHDDLDDEDDELDVQDEEEDDEQEDDDDGHLPEDKDARFFFKEVLDSLQRSYEEKVQPENLVMEINGSRSAYNVFADDVIKLVLEGLLSLPQQLNKNLTLDMKEYWKALNPILKYFFPVLRNYLKNEKSELIFLHALEEYGVQHDHCARIICQILKLLYDADILNEETIIKWNLNPPEDPLASETVRVYVQPFIDWLNEAEEETDESD